MPSDKQTPSTEDIQAILADPDNLLAHAGSFWKEEAKNWEPIDNSIWRNSYRSANRAARVHKRLHELMAEVWKLHLRIILPDAQPTTGEKLNKLQGEIKAAESKLVNYFDACLNGKVGGTITFEGISNLFGDDEKDLFDGYRAPLMEHDRNLWEWNSKVFTDKRRAEQPRLFKKYLVQLKICELLNENVKDSRIILVPGQQALEGDAQPIPPFFGGGTCENANEIKQCMKVRTAKIRGWLELYETLKFEYK